MIVINFGSDTTFEHKVDVLQNLVGEHLTVVTDRACRVAGELLGCAGESVYVGQPATACGIERVIGIEVAL